ncbi:serine/threonine-protein kinase doa [Plakobranchus ocellatus]|uniref:Serine/threonine-protein kinase doa n=1 Tax=Plakobranchus ocellatus TaxID=259542 RepID=A0AAV4B471_9GAST|nr:serine/threonine-protein kinase doa [Plakobranchus ocellatus]
MYQTLFEEKLKSTGEIHTYTRYMKEPEDEDHQQLFELISRLLTYEPSQRFTLRQAMRHAFFLPYQRDQASHRGLDGRDPARSNSASDRCRSHSLSR